MAASCALSCCWRQAAAAGSGSGRGWRRILALPELCTRRQLHVVSSLRRARPQILLSAQEPRLLILGVLERAQSTSAPSVAEIPGPAQSSPPLSPLTDVAPTLVDTAGELSLTELGLAGATPVGVVQNILESLHLSLGLPWWGAIVTGTVLVRCVVIPLIVKGQQEAAKLNNHMPEISKLTARIDEAKRSGNKFEFSKAYTDLRLYQKKHNVNPLRGFLVPLVQAPIFISFFIALREMASLPVPSMQTGGLWWFTDLTVADPYYILPLMVTCSMWAILELGAESGVDNPNLRVMKTVFRFMPVVILPLTINFPTAIFTYWMSSNLFSLAQVGFLRIPAVRRKLKIPEKVKHDPSVLPQQKGFLKSMKSGWKNAQMAQQMEERERRIKYHLENAAKGPLRQTFSHNPLQQQAPSPVAASGKQKVRPWQDTIG